MFELTRWIDLNHCMRCVYHTRYQFAQHTMFALLPFPSHSPTLWIVGVAVIFYFLLLAKRRVENIDKPMHKLDVVCCFLFQYVFGLCFALCFGAVFVASNKHEWNASVNLYLFCWFLHFGSSSLLLLLLLLLFFLRASCCCCHSIGYWGTFSFESNYRARYCRMWNETTNIVLVIQTEIDTLCDTETSADCTVRRMKCQNVKDTIAFALFSFLSLTCRADSISKLYSNKRSSPMQMSKMIRLNSEKKIWNRPPL